MRLNGPAPRVVVCDNASSDGSMEMLRQWARGELPVEAPASPIASGYAPVARDHRCYGRVQAERGGAADDPPLVFIETGGNLGFAGGNNVGLRYALARGDARHVWLLNNDAVADPDALRALVDRIEADKAGMCGSTVLHYADPETCQARCGGRFDYAKGGPTGHIGEGMKRAELARHPVDPATIDYVMGASMLVSRAFLERVGLMWEGYFLFFEEIDWAERGRRAGFSLAYAPDSFVWHKGGASTGKLVDASYYGSPTDHYFLRNRLLFTRRHRPWLLPL
ncbi:MAG: glycosyltransferase family 2 protein, partial [Alphaproteobacteria bacterium]|nr:glycosyltransferase family 2 protein [Alphaproteobacteria bacterium]